MNRKNRQSLQRQRHTNLTRAQAQSCSQKLPYDSKTLALRALRHHAQHYKGMNAYHCLICRKYHLGRQDDPAGAHPGCHSRQRDPHGAQAQPGMTNPA